jgi:starch phosphorylase
VVELLLGRPGESDDGKIRSYRLEHVGPLAHGAEHLYTLALTPELCGKLDYRIRAYPYHELLTHRFEMGMMRWL